MSKILLAGIIVMVAISCKKQEQTPNYTIMFVSHSDNVWMSLDGEQHDLNNGDRVEFNPYRHDKLHVVCTACSYSINHKSYSGTRSFNVTHLMNE